MPRQMIIALGLVAALVACRPDPKPPPDQPKHVLLEGLQPPPLNTPIHQPSEKEQATPVQLPPGPASALVAIRDGRPFAGDATLTGRLTISGDRIRIDPTTGSSLELFYRLPSGLQSPDALAGDGTIEIHERSGPASADRRVLVRSGSKGILGEIWQRSAKPPSLDLGNGVRLVQSAVRGSPRTGYTEAPLAMLEGGRVVGQVPIGRATEIQTGSGRYVVFAEISHLLTPSAGDFGQVEGGYILRAWVVSAM
jgi:hypothetical protein